MRARDEDSRVTNEGGKQNGTRGRSRGGNAPWLKMCARQGHVSGKIVPQVISYVLLTNITCAVLARDHRRRDDRRASVHVTDFLRVGFSSEAETASDGADGRLFHGFYWPSLTDKTPLKWGHLSMILISRAGKSSEQRCSLARVPRPDCFVNRQFLRPALRDSVGRRCLSSASADSFPRSVHGRRYLYLQLGNSAACCGGVCLARASRSVGATLPSLGENPESHAGCRHSRRLARHASNEGRSILVGVAAGASRLCFCAIFSRRSAHRTVREMGALPRDDDGGS